MRGRLHRRAFDNRHGDPVRGALLEASALITGFRRAMSDGYDRARLLERNEEIESVCAYIDHAISLTSVPNTRDLQDRARRIA
jgi:hypothetical protein